MVVPVRFLLIAVLVFAAMGLVANGALLTRARVNAGCTTMNDGAGPALRACHRGWFKGYPNLMDKGCTAVGVTAKLQYWSCPKS